MKTKKKGSVSPVVKNVAPDSFIVSEPDTFVVYDEPTFDIKAKEGYDIVKEDNIIRIPVKVGQKILMPYRHIEKTELALDSVEVPRGFRLRLNVAQKYAERGIILLEELPWLMNSVKSISIGHIGKQIIEIANGDHLFVGWLEESFSLE
jgi:hypothetical protein